MSDRRRGRSRTKRARFDDGDSSRSVSLSLPHTGFTRLSSSLRRDVTQSAIGPPLPPGVEIGAHDFRLETTIAESQIPLGKIAIPALTNRHSRSDSKRSRRSDRNSHACDACRKAKAGCSGGQPCQRCRIAETPCIYGDGKRDRDRKRLSRLGKEARTLNQHNADMKYALSQARSDNSLSMDELKLAIDQILAMVPTPVSDEGSAPASRRASRQPGRGTNDDETSVRGFGSTESLDVIHVAGDIIRDAKDGLNWLRMISARSISARKAWEIFDSLLRVVAPLVNGSTDDMPLDAPIPPNYNWRRFCQAAVMPAHEQAHDPTAPSPGYSVADLEGTQTLSQDSNPITIWHVQQDYTLRPSGSRQDTNEREMNGYSGQMLNNPLDHTRALEDFSLIGNLHGQYDELWQLGFSEGDGDQ